MGRQAGERGLARDQLVRHAAEGVDVGAVIGRGIARRLLGGHVGRCPDGGAQLGERGTRRTLGGGRDGLGDAEIGDDRGVAGEQDVVRLDVAVHDAVVVGVGERARDVAQDAHDLGDGQRPAGQPRAQAFALDERHGVVGETVDHAGREDRHDVRLLERGGDPDFALEAAGGHRRGDLGRQDLHHHLAAEPLLVGDEDPGHAATAELALEGVATGKRLLNARSQVVHETRNWGWV